MLVDRVDQIDPMDKLGASCDTPWVCLPQFGMARAKIYHRGMRAFRRRGSFLSQPPRRGLSGGQPVCLPRRSPERGEDGTGRATHPTTTRLFLPSFFSPAELPTNSSVGDCQEALPLTGRATHPTATRLFLPSFFSPGKKAEDHAGRTEGTAVGNAVKDRPFKGVGAGIGGKIGVISAENEIKSGNGTADSGEQGRSSDQSRHI